MISEKSGMALEQGYPGAKRKLVELVRIPFLPLCLSSEAACPVCPTGISPSCLLSTLSSLV